MDAPIHIGALFFREVYILNQKVSLAETLLAILIVFVFMTVTAVSLIFGAVVLPFVVLYLLRLKHKSNYHFWLIFFSFMVPALLFLQPSVWLWFVILYILTSVIHNTLVKETSQELTLFYTTFTLALGAVGGVNILQMLGLMEPLADTYLSFRSWYTEQLENFGSEGIAGVDIELFREALDQFFVNLPGYITIVSFFIALYTVLMLRITIGGSGLKPWPRLAFSEWKFPRFTLYLFLILFIVSFFTNTDEGTFATIVSNAYLIALWAIFIHGLAFIYFFFLEKNMNKVVSILLLVPLAILRPVTVVIGLFEMMFRLRQMIIMKRK